MNYGEAYARIKACTVAALCVKQLCVCVGVPAWDNTRKAADGVMASVHCE